MIIIVSSSYQFSTFNLFSLEKLAFISLPEFLCFFCLQPYPLPPFSSVALSRFSFSFFLVNFSINLSSYVRVPLCVFLIFFKRNTSPFERQSGCYYCSAASECNSCYHLKATNIMNGLQLTSQVGVQPYLSVLGNRW